LNQRHLVVPERDVKHATFAVSDRPQNRLGAAGSLFFQRVVRRREHVDVLVEPDLVIELVVCQEGLGQTASDGVIAVRPFYFEDAAISVSCFRALRSGTEEPESARS
jgi:hypothetical protein